MKQLWLAMRLGWRFSRTKHNNGFITFISTSSILGIALGSLVLIMVLSAMNGFERELRDRLLSVVPHGELRAVNGELDDWQQSMAVAASHPQVDAAAPMFELPAMVEKNNVLQALTIRGVDTELEPSVSSITRMLKHNNWTQLNDGRAIILGSALAKKLKVKVGDNVSVLYSAPSDAQSFKAPKRFVFTLVDVFEVGGQLDSMQGYISLASAQTMANITGVQGIRVKIKDIYAAARITHDVAMQMRQYVYIHDWTRTQGHLYHDIQLVRMVLWVVMTLVIAVACFNIVSTLVMAVKEKRGDIAILSTMGMERLGIMLIFSIQGLYNGIVGSVLGCIFGVLAAENLSSWLATIENLLGTKILSGEVYFINFIPSQLNYTEVWIIGVVGIALAFIATLYPAFQATKVNPAEQLGNQ